MKSGSVKLAVSSLLGLTGLCASLAHSADPLEQLKACGRIADQDTRLACYDDLRDQIIDGESSQEPKLADDIGGPAFEDESKNPKKQDKGVVTSCEKGRSQRWYFYFENGQVWREVNTGRHRFRDCSFDVTITRDGFGYRMRVEGANKVIRVSRIR